MLKAQRKPDLPGIDAPSFQAARLLYATCLIALFCFYFLDVYPWGQLHLALEDARETQGVLIADLFGDFSDAEVRRFQVFPAFLDAEIDQILMRCPVCRFMENGGQIGVVQ